MDFKFILKYKVLMGRSNSQNDVLLKEFKENEKDEAIQYARQYVKKFKDKHIRVELFRYANEKNFNRDFHYDYIGVWNSNFHD